MKEASSHHMSSIDFDLRQLEIFQKVVELKSFSKAADAVFLAQASVSERIATLENLVGTKLLDRLRREVVPTKAGEILYKHAVLLLDMKRTACLEMLDFLGMKRGDVHLGGSTIPGENILPKILGRFHEKYPFVSVTLTIADSSEIEKHVVQGDFELGVIGSRGSHKNILYQELWEDELVIAVPADHRWTKEPTVRLEELLKEPFILREVGSGTLKIMEHYLRQAGDVGVDAFRVVARLGSSTAIKEGIKAGLGVSILSKRALDTELKTGVLKALRLPGLSMTRHFFLLRDKRRIASPLCRAMTEFLLSSSRE